MEEYENFIHTKYGYCYYALRDNEPAVIFNLYVEPEYRRQGHARNLLQAVITEIKSVKYEGEIKIEAKPRDNSIGLEKLEALYKSMGLVIL
jgi:ribosomal protein S18 acetylase RimI-like enzyme